MKKSSTVRSHLLKGKKVAQGPGKSKSSDGRHARKAWSAYWGKKVPRGYIVNHKDGNPENNAPTNLGIVSRAKHNRIHKKGKSLGEQRNASRAKPNIGTADGLQRRYRKRGSSGSNN